MNTTLRIPQDKSPEFKMELFTVFSQAFEEIAFNNEKAPNSILFTGKLGKEVFDLINELKWDLNGMNPTFKPSNVSRITIGYKEALNKIEHDSIIRDSIDGKMIEGIPTAEAMKGLMSSYISPNFKKEKTIRPEKIIHLVRPAS